MTIEQIAERIAQNDGLHADQASLVVEKGLDSTGDKAVWVWITLKQWPDFGVRQQLREQVFSQVQELEGDDFVYVRFQNAAELAAS